MRGAETGESGKSGFAWAATVLTGVGLCAPQFLFGGLWYPVFLVPALFLLGIGCVFLCAVRTDGRGAGLWRIGITGAVACYFACRMVFGDDHTLSLGDALLLVGGLMCYLAGVGAGGKPKHALCVVCLFMAAAGVQTILAGAQYTDGSSYHPLAWVAPSLHLPVGGDPGRYVSGTLFGKGPFAGVLGIGAMLSLGICIWGRCAAWAKVLTAWLSMVFSAGVALSGSRAGMVGLGFGFSAFFLLSLFALLRARESVSAPLSVAAFSGLAVPIAAVAFLATSSWHVESTLRRLFDDPYREYIWTRAAPEIFRKSPWIGSGANSFSLLSLRHKDAFAGGNPVFAHNDWLQTALDYGIFGLSGALLVLGLHLTGAASNALRRAADLSSAGLFPQSQRLGLWFGGIGAVAFASAQCFFDYTLHCAAVFFPSAFCLGLCSHLHSPRGAAGRSDRVFHRFAGVAIRWAGVLVGVVAVFWCVGHWRDEKLILDIDCLFAKGGKPAPEKRADLARAAEGGSPRLERLEAFCLLRDGMDSTDAGERVELFGKSARLYKKSAEKRPENPDILREAGVALSLAGEGEEGENLLSRAVSLNPFDAKGYLCLAANLRMRGRADEAKTVEGEAKRLPGGRGAGSKAAGIVP